MEEREYMEDIKIDPDQLDVEWLEQPTLFLHYSNLKTEAERTAKRAHENLKTVRSELRMRAAEGGEELIGCKPIDANVDAWVRSQKEYQDAKKEQIEAEYEADMLNNVTFAFHQRKAALENLVRLYGQQYFAGPKEPRDLAQEYSISQQAKEVKSRKVRDKLKEAAKKTPAQKKPSKRTKFKKKGK